MCPFTKITRLLHDNDAIHSSGDNPKIPMTAHQFHRQWSAPSSITIDIGHFCSDASSQHYRAQQLQPVFALSLTAHMNRCHGLSFSAKELSSISTITREGFTTLSNLIPIDTLKNTFLHVPFKGSILATRFITGGTLTLLLATQAVYAQSVSGSGDLVPTPLPGINSWNVNTLLTVGNTSSAVLDIMNGGYLNSSSNIYIGRNTGSNGRVTVSGLDAALQASLWDHFGFLTVGENGTGTLNILDGGRVSSSGNGSYIGTRTTGNGTVTVSGSNSLWTNNGAMNVAESGIGKMSILDGGEVKNLSGSNVILGRDKTGVGTVIVSGKDSNAIASTWTTSNILYVGNLGTGILEIHDGAQVRIASTIMVGYGSVGTLVPDSTVSGSILVTGAGSRLQGNHQMTVGNLNPGFLTIADGGVVNVARWMFIGNAYTGVGNISGGSTLTVGEVLTVGNNNSGILNIKTGSTVKSQNGIIGGNTGSFGIGNGDVVVNGNGALWEVDNVLTIANSGMGQISLADGGKVSAGIGTVVANNNGSTGTIIIGSSSIGSSVAPGQITTPSISFGAGNASLILNHNDTTGNYTIDSVLQGTKGSIDIYNGITVLAGNNSYTGNVTIHGGLLQIGNGATQGSMAANITNNAELNFNRSDSTYYDALLSGTGTLSKQGSGELALSAANTYTGDTTVSDGTLLLAGAGSISASQQLSLQGTAAFDISSINSSTTVNNLTGTTNTSITLGNKTLSLNNTNNTLYAGSLSGIGNLIKIGTGTLIYNGDGTDFTGVSTVTEGSLIVGSDTAHAGAVWGGSLTVENGALLGGNGTIGSSNSSIVTVESGGILSPGDSIGTTTLLGNHVVNPGAIYEVEINAAGQSDLTQVTGITTLNGGIVRLLPAAGVYQPNMTYTLLTAAGGVTGTFDGLEIPAPGFSNPLLTPTLSYDSNNVFLTLRLADDNDVSAIPTLSTSDLMALIIGMGLFGAGMKGILVRSRRPSVFYAK